MPHVKRVWVDENVQFPNRYLVDGVQKTIVRDVGAITVQDPISAAKMNAIENSLAEIIGSYAVAFYVNGTTGNDSNTGLSSGAALKTIAKALSMLPTVIYQDVIIYIADGTYAATISVSGKVGPGTLTLQGNTTTIGNVKFTSVSTDNNMAEIKIAGIEATVTTAGIGFISTGDANVIWDRCRSIAVSASSAGFYGYRTKVVASLCVASNRAVGIGASDNSDITVIDCSGSANTFGVRAVLGGTIRITGTYPTSTTNPMYQETGGQIFRPDGVWKHSGFTRYGSLTELGLNETTATVAQIHAAMPTKSILDCSVNLNNNMPTPNTYYHLQVVKGLDGAQSFYRATRRLPASGHKVAEGVYYQGSFPDFTGWINLYHDDNAGKMVYITGNYTLTADDNHKILVSVATSDIIITVPDFVDYTYEVTIVQGGTFGVTMAPGAGVNLQSHPDSTKRKTNGLNAFIYLRRTLGSGVYLLAGNLKA